MSRWKLGLVTDKLWRVIDLWNGRIISVDRALQLLLIVDYIFDRARDIYRETIIGELRKLSANNTLSLANDRDVFSLMDRVAFWPQEKEPSDGGGPTETETLPNLRYMML